MDIYTIYKATNKINGKAYIGFDSNWPKRQKTHKTKYNKSKTKFYSALKKHGWNNFDWSILYQSKDKEHCLNVMEPYFIKEYNSFENGYNMTFGGEAVMINRTHSPETKEKMKLSHEGKKHSVEVLDKQRKSIQNFFDNNGSRNITKCCICEIQFKHPKHKSRICCSNSCAATYRNLKRKNHAPEPGLSPPVTGS